MPAQADAAERATAATAAGEAPIAADEARGTADGTGSWSRVHPATPLLRSWQVFLVGLFIFGQDFGEALVLGGDRGWTSLVTENQRAGTAVAGVLLGMVALGAWLSWHRTRYRVADTALEFERGVVFRHQRRAPLDRLQAVDLTEPLLARLVGLAKLTLEVAGGSDSKVEIAYLTRADALGLRDHLLAVASGVATDGVALPQVGQAPENVAVRVPTGRLLASTLLSFAPATIGLTMATAGVIAVTGEIGSLLPVALLAIVIGAGAWTAFVRSFEFRVAAAADGVRIQRGLLEKRTQTVPPGRVQAVRLSQPLLWRIPGWWLVEVNVAGYGAGRGERSELDTVVLPVGTSTEARAVLSLLIGDVFIDHDALVGSGDRSDFVAAPRRARWVDPIAWRRHGFRVDPVALVLRGGRLRRRLDVVPHARTQSSALRRGPLQRGLGLATFELHSTPGPVRPRVEHLHTATVVELLEEQAVRARAERARVTDEWLAPALDAPNAADPMTATSDAPSTPPH